jgi:hypothetical protein
MVWSNSVDNIAYFLYVEDRFAKASLVPHQFGRLPIELAAEYGTREDVEILFPFTSPISTVANWTVDGIIKHVEMKWPMSMIQGILDLRCRMQIIAQFHFSAMFILTYFYHSLQG